MAQPNWWQRVGARIANMVRPDDPWRWQQWVSFDQPSGVNITPDTALELSAVWACVNVLANAIAASPWHIVTMNGENRQETLPDDPLYYLLNTRPNSEMTASAFREALMWCVLTWGNGYAEIGRSLSGKVTALWPLLPNRTFPRRDPETSALYYEHRDQNGLITRLEPSQVYHLKGPGITGLLGDNITARAAKSLGLAAAQDRFASTYFGNGTVIGGVLEYPGKLPRDKDGRPDSTFDRLQKDWAAQHQGPNKAHHPAILENGMKWVPFSAKAQEAQLVEGRKFAVEEIARWYGVPAHMIGHAAASQGYGKNLEELGLGFVRHTLRPWAVRLEQEADYKLFVQRAPWKTTHLDFRHLSRGDAKTQAEANEIRRRNGVISINEWREEDGLNHIGEDGDVRVVLVTYQTVEQLIAPPPPPPAPAGLPGNPAAPAEEAAAPAEDPAKSEDDGDSQGDEPTNVVREALILLFASTLERYRSRLVNREADLRRGGGSDAKVRAHLAEERIKLRPWMLEQAADAMKLAGTTDADLVGAADSIDNGTDPRAAAELLVANRKAAA